MNTFDRARLRIAAAIAGAQAYLGRLSTVSAVSPGQGAEYPRPDDGLQRISPLPYDIDRPPETISQDFSDALDAWRTNPLARRIVTLLSAYVVGDGITLSSTYGPLRRFLEIFWTHPQNDMPTRQRDWCDELTRTGELFVVLHTNPADGMSYVRAISAGAIDTITTQPGDYETELTYHETVPMDDPDYKDGGRTWFSPEGENRRQREGERSPSLPLSPSPPLPPVPWGPLSPSCCILPSIAPSEPSAANQTWPPSSIGSSATTVGSKIACA
jgi:hypothetical protein